MRFVVFSVCVLLWSSLLARAPLAWAQSKGNRAQVLVEQRRDANRAMAQSQKRIDKIHAHTESMLEEYRALQESLIAARAQTAQLDRELRQQSKELTSLEAQVSDAAQVRLELAPLLERMVQALDDFVALDLPFLPRERKARSRALHALLGNAQAPIAQRARRVFEAYMVELGYGQSLEAYEDQIDLQGEKVAVQMLRVGRVGLYYLSLDGARAGRFNPVTRRFETLDEDAREGVRQAISVAQKRLPPQLITLPVTRSRSEKGVRS